MYIGRSQPSIVIDVQMLVTHAATPAHRQADCYASPVYTWGDQLQERHA